MAKTPKTKGFEKLSDPEKYLVAGPGGATHKTADAAPGSLTTNQGVVVADNQNTLKSGGRGPSLLEDFAFREKKSLRDALEKEGAELAIVAPRIGGVRLKSGKHLAADMALSGTPSVFFDAVAIFASAEGIKPLLKNSAAIDWVRDAFGHLKVICCTATAQPLFAKAGIADDLDEGVIELDARASIGQYIEAAKQQRVWDREARLSGDNA
jgi:C-terminal domain found in long catalases